MWLYWVLCLQASYVAAGKLTDGFGDEHCHSAVHT